MQQSYTRNHRRSVQSTSTGLEAPECMGSYKKFLFTSTEGINRVIRFVAVREKMRILQVLADAWRTWMNKLDSIWSSMIAEWIDPNR